MLDYSINHSRDGVIPLVQLGRIFRTSHRLVARPRYRCRYLRKRGISQARLSKARPLAKTHPVAVCDVPYPPILPGSRTNQRSPSVPLEVNHAGESLVFLGLNQLLPTTDFRNLLESRNTDLPVVRWPHRRCPGRVLGYGCVADSRYGLFALKAACICSRTSR